MLIIPSLPSPHPPPPSISTLFPSFPSYMQVMAAPKIAAPLKPVRKDHPQYADPADLLNTYSEDTFLEPRPSPIFPLRPPPVAAVDHAQTSSWEVRAFEEDFQSASGGVWPPRSYWCGFCRREFRSAQALGGHMNVHRRDRARLRLLPQAGAPSEPLYPTGNTDQATPSAPSTPLGLLNPILPTSLSHNNHSSHYYPLNPYFPPSPLQVMQKRLPDRGSWYSPIDAESELQQIGGSSPNYQTLRQHGTEETDVRSVDLELRLGQTN